MSYQGQNCCLGREGVGLGGYSELNLPVASAERCFGPGAKGEALLLAMQEVLRLTAPRWFLILIPEMKHRMMPLLGRRQLNTVVKNDSTDVQIDCKSSPSLKGDQCFFFFWFYFFVFAF